MDLTKIKKVDFPETQYYKQEFPKSQIYLHHTVSGDNADGDVNYWKNTPERIATAIVIERDGDIIQCFSSKYWAHHLGVTSAVFNKYSMSNTNLQLNQCSIGIELDSWGGLIKDADGKFYPAKIDSSGKFVANKAVKPIVDVVEYPNGFRGFYAFEKYTDKQIYSAKELILYWSGVYGIPTTYHDDIFDVTKRALNHEKGVFTHCSVRSDKSDTHKQKELVDMLKSLPQ